MPLSRQNISSGSRWEPIVGYSRAVRVGPYVHVAGTTAVNTDGELVGRKDPYAQARHIFGTILTALREAGASAADVVRTRMYVTDIGHWQEVGRAHHEVFGDVRPAATLIEVSGLVDPDMLVEIEVDAILPNE